MGDWTRQERRTGSSLAAAITWCGPGVFGESTGAEKNLKPRRICTNEQLSEMTRPTTVSTKDQEGIGRGDTNEINASSPPRFVYQWNEGTAYELIRGRFYFSAHPSDKFTMAAIRHFPRRYYFSNDLPGTACGPRACAQLVASPACVTHRGMKILTCHPYSSVNDREVRWLLQGLWPDQHRPRHALLQVCPASVRARTPCRRCPPPMQSSGCAMIPIFYAWFSGHPHPRIPRAVTPIG